MAKTNDCYCSRLGCGSVALSWKHATRAFYLHRRHYGKPCFARTMDVLTTDNTTVVKADAARSLMWW